jgi:ABC-2 type transport system ATP-binding protein
VNVLFGINRKIQISELLIHVNTISFKYREDLPQQDIILDLPYVFTYHNRRSIVNFLVKAIPGLRYLLKTRDKSIIRFEQFELINTLIKAKGDVFGFSAKNFADTLQIVDKFVQSRKMEGLFSGFFVTKNIENKINMIPAILKGEILKERMIFDDGFGVKSNVLLRDIFSVNTPPTLINKVIRMGTVLPECLLTKNEIDIPVRINTQFFEPEFIKKLRNLSNVERKEKRNGNIQEDNESLQKNLVDSDLKDKLIANAYFHPISIYLKIGPARSEVQNIIRVKDLTVKFGKRVILNKVNFTIEKGSMIGIVGESGAGKSTTVKAMLGQLKYEGKIRILGIDALETKRIAPYIGYVPQDLSLIYHDFTPMENCIHFARQYGLDEDEITPKAKQILGDLNLGAWIDKKVGDLSGGQKRRVSIAMAMIHNPMIIILDEPTSGLDPMTRFDLWRYLDKINKTYGITLIVISHYLDEIEYSDKSAVYLNGVGFFDFDKPHALKEKLPGKGFCLEVTLEKVELKASDLIKSVPNVEEVVQRGERIRVLSNNDLNTLIEPITKILEENEIKVSRIDENAHVDMMDYFTIYSRKIGSGKLFLQTHTMKDALYKT